jgi:hypothetical protein
MDLAPSRAALVAARPGHTPRPCTAMEAAESGVSLLLGGSTHLHHVDPRRRLRPRASPDRVAPPLSCHLAGYIRSPAAVSFWNARSLIGIELPIARRPRAYYSGIGIEWAIGCPGTPSVVHLPSPHGCMPHWLVINTIAGYYVHILRATGLQLCRLIGPQHRRPCVRFVVASISPSPVHRQLCCIIPVALSVCTRSLSC